MKCQNENVRNSKYERMQKTLIMFFNTGIWSDLAFIIVAEFKIVVLCSSTWKTENTTS